MIYTDCHLHTDFSADCKVPPELMIEEGIKLGLKTICFTDHMDIDFPDNCNLDFTFNINDYVKKMEEMQFKYKKDIQILIGVELGLQTHITQEMTDFINKYPFDFIIGSSHLVDKIDPYDSLYWYDTEEEGMRRYFNSIIDNCNAFDKFHIYGHLDYAIRYSKEKGNGEYKYTYENYKDIIDRTLETIISKGKGIEVNSSGLAYGLGFTHPKKEILKRYKELGGEILTIGSDAHKPERMAYGFNQIEEMLKEINYRYYTVFEKGKANMIRL